MTGMSDEQLAAIGYLIVMWNGLERNLVACIWKAGGWTQEIGEMVTADLGNVARIDLLLNLVNHSIKEDELIHQEISLNCKLFDYLRSARNELAHGYFHWRSRGLETDDHLLNFSAKRRKGSVEMKKTPIKLSYLREVSSDIALCNEFWNDIMHKIHFRQCFIAQEEWTKGQTYHDIVHGWRAPSLEISLLQECLAKHQKRQAKPQHRPPPQSSQA